MMPKRCPHLRWKTGHVTQNQTNEQHKAIHFNLNYIKKQPTRGCTINSKHSHNGQTNKQTKNFQAAIEVGGFKPQFDEHFNT